MVHVLPVIPLSLLVTVYVLCACCLESGQLQDVWALVLSQPSIYVHL